MARWAPPLVRPLVIPRDKLIREMPYPTEIRPVEAAFNNSVTSWEGRTWLAYRIESRPFFRHARIAVCELDKYYQPMGASVILPLETGFGGSRAEDPRWVIMNGKSLLLAYNDNHRQWYAEMKSPTEVGKCWKMRTSFPQQEREKNWGFFSSTGESYALYDSGENWRVLKVDGPNGRLAYQCKWPAHLWEYGLIRGGASPVLHNGKFYHWFHSSAGIDATKFGVVRRYFCGVMTFMGEPPFTPLALCEEPVLRGTAERTADPKSSLNPAVFPCGARRLHDTVGWEVSYGINNLNCGAAFVSDALVEKLLKPVKVFQ